MIEVRTGSFPWAIRNLTVYNYKVTRKEWNGKGMYLILVSEWIPTEKPSISPVDAFAPFIAMKTADNKLVPWLASQTDMLAEDWEMVE